ncbi:lysozyme [Pseudoduganella umbonata]|uniref:Lysozyme n=1 Tax=Pseudoduganella umbonata TaxID=864828 RepID=A0A4P8HTQ2_9BURK|nr:lysozyme [Pseudoduganella umbonata]MBB3220376.1 lysozyme [Pseudoduganella umbonata]QCP12088.1 lysozyme [Pseudoduganella umbonata]
MKKRGVTHRIVVLSIALLSVQLPHGAYAQQMSPVGVHVTSQSLIEDLSAPLGVATSGTARPLTPITLLMIKDFEGWAALHYDDPAGYCTIGYGHLISLKRCMHTPLGKFANQLSLGEGNELLEFDTRSARRTVQQLVSTELTDDQYGALASFVFNIGKRKFAESTMLALLNMKEFDAASKEFRRWIKAKGEVLDGLVDRRKCEEALFNKVLRLDKEGKFNRNMCQSFGAAPSENLIDIEIGEQLKGVK